MNNEALLENYVIAPRASERTVAEFWDCNCDGPFFFRPRAVKVCEVCGAYRDHQPDAHFSEVEARGAGREGGVPLRDSDFRYVLRSVEGRVPPGQQIVVQAGQKLDPDWQFTFDSYDEALAFVKHWLGKVGQLMAWRELK